MLNRLARGRGPAQWLRLELLVLATLGMLALVARRLAFTDPDLYFLSYSLPGTFLWLAAGMGLAAVSVAFAGRERESRLISAIAARPNLLWAASLAVWVAMIAFVPTALGRLVIPGFFGQVSQHLAHAILALLLVMPAVFTDDPPEPAQNRALEQAGDVDRGDLLRPLPVAHRRSGHP